jgi:hypothetical protein
MVPVGREFDRLLTRIGWWRLNWYNQVFCTLVVVTLGVLVTAVPIVTTVKRLVVDGERPRPLQLALTLLVLALGILVLPLVFALAGRVVANHPGPLI